MRHGPIGGQCRPSGWGGGWRCGDIEGAHPLSAAEADYERSLWWRELWLDALNLRRLPVEKHDQRLAADGFQLPPPEAPPRVADCEEEWPQDPDFCGSKPAPPYGSAGGESDSDEEDTEESGKSSGVWTSWRLKRARCPTCTAEAWHNGNGVYTARRLCV